MIAYVAPYYKKSAGASTVRGVARHHKSYVVSNPEANAAIKTLLQDQNGCSELVRFEANSSQKRPWQPHQTFLILGPWISLFRFLLHYALYHLIMISD